MIRAEEKSRKETFMKAFFYYFFGQGQEQEFALFTFSHIVPILVGLGLIFLIWCLRDKIAGWKKEGYIRYALAFVLILSDMSYYWRLTCYPGLSGSLQESLPLTVCGWAAIFCSYMVVGKSKSLFDICYFWLLAGSIFALLTPTPLNYTGFTRFRYYQFWTEHIMGYVAIFYMIFVHKMRPTIRSAVKSYIALVVLALVAYFTNRMIGPGANYLFLARPEATPSVLDILPPMFWLRTLIMAAVVTALYGVAYLPWYLRDRKTKKVGVDTEEHSVSADIL